MTVNLYTSTGCIRCNIIKKYFEEHAISYAEYDIKTATGDSAFKNFYKEHRKSIKRDQSGIFFPIFQQREIIRQDAGAILAWLIGKGQLDHAIRPNNMEHGWIGGLDLSFHVTSAEQFCEIVERLKSGGLKTCVTTNGNNGSLLESLVSHGLIDRLEFELLGPKSFYQNENPDIPVEDIEKTIRCLNGISNLIIVTRVQKIIKNGNVGYMETEQIAQAARWLNEIGQNSKFPYYIDVEKNGSQGENSTDTIGPFSYRTAARRWQVLTEILPQTEPSV